MKQSLWFRGRKKKALDFNILSSTLMLSLQGEDTHGATDDLARVIKRQQGTKKCFCCSGKILDNISVSPHLHSQKIRNKERIWVCAESCFLITAQSHSSQLRQNCLQLSTQDALSIAYSNPFMRCDAKSHSLDERCWIIATMCVPCGDKEILYGSIFYSGWNQKQGKAAAVTNILRNWMLRLNISCYRILKVCRVLQDLWETKDGSPYFFFRPHPHLVSKGMQGFLGNVKGDTVSQLISRISEGDNDQCWLLQIFIFWV